jgi:hypothetical protein
MAKSEEIVLEAAAKKANPSAYPEVKPTHWARKAEPQQPAGSVDKTPTPIVKVLPKTLKPSKF